jgi:integrase
MAKGDPRARIVWRAQGGVARAYLEARDLGYPNRVALKPEGGRHATTDPAEAEELAAAFLERVRTDEQQRRAERQRQRQLGLVVGAELRAFADQHIAQMEDAGNHSPEWLDNLARYLDRAVAFFNVVQPAHASSAADRLRCASPRNLATISVPDVRAFVAWLKQQDNGRGGTLGAQSIRHHLAALGGVFGAAVGDGLLPLGHDPVAALPNRPGVPKSRTPLREPWEIALLLEAARTLNPAALALSGRRRPLECVHALLAFFCYTGARESEVRRVDVRDLHFASRMGPQVVIHGAEKGKKRETYELERWVPMHPPLVPILRAHVRSLGRLAGPLFTNNDGEPLGDWGKSLQRVAVAAGFARGELDTRQLRKAYATHRSTSDDVDANAVRLEMGHSNLKMMAAVYANAQRRSERMGEVFSYEWDRWAASVPPERLDARAAPSPAAAERAALVAAFLASVAGWSAPRAMAETGIDDAVINRLRAGQGTVKGKTLDRIRAYLAGHERARA